MRTRAFTILFLFFAIVNLFEDEAKPWGPITHMTILDDVLKDSRLNQDVRKVLQENLKHAKGGATGPDMYYFFDKRYSDIAHYCSPGDYARRMLDMAKKDGDPKKIAFTYGWMIHVATDAIGHKWVNSEAGGEYNPNNPEIVSAHSNIEQSIDKKNLLDHGQQVTDPETGAILYYYYNTDIDSPDIFNFKVFSNFFGCRENAPTADLGEAAENIAQLVYNAYPFWILSKDENQFNTAEYQDAYQNSISEAIRALNSAGGTLMNWDLDTGQAPYDDYGNPNQNYGGNQKCKDYGQLNDCGPVTKSTPGGDYPDDTVSVSTGTNISETVSLDSLYRLAAKKGKLWTLWLKALQDANAEYEGLPPEASPEQRQDELEKIFALIDKLNDPFKYREFVVNNPQLSSEILEVPDIAVLENGYFEEMTNLITKNHEPVRTVSIGFSPNILGNHPVLLIPSGGLYGLENSEIFRASLDEYVKNGGTLIVFAQQHGYEFLVLPVPQEEDSSYNKIGGYGWSEDQSCFVNAAYIETWHQMLAGQSKSTPSFHMDGYFTNYPSNSTVLLRRTANGQPALLMYEYGQGRVIVTSMYSDHALKLNQASSEEIALIRDMISWAKKPDELPEAKPGETVSASVEAANVTTNDASSVRLSVYNPDRTTLLSEQTVNISIPAGQTATIPVIFTTTQISTLGIYHIDYTLLDASGRIIQPQTETDSGRFVVSDPPKTGGPDKSIWLSVTTSSQEVLFGTPFDYMMHIYNNTDQIQNLKITMFFMHTFRSHNWSVVANPNSETTISGTDIFLDIKMSENMRFILYDQLYNTIATNDLNFRGKYPNIALTVNTDKIAYNRGETGKLNIDLKNNTPSSCESDLWIYVTDPKNTEIFSDIKSIAAPPSFQP